MALRVPGQTTPSPAPAVIGPQVATGPAPGQHDAIVQVPIVDLAKAIATEVAGALAVADAAQAATVVGIDLPNFANSVTGVYGISGTGKTSLLVTACEFCWEEFEMISLVYGTDLGGFGNKMLSLIRHGIVRVWDPRNHVNSFETMEACSYGAWPETMIDPQTGRAAPNVRLILPRRVTTQLQCPQGHPVARFDLASPRDAGLFEVGNYPCPTCGVLTTKSNGTTTAQIVRHKMFAKVGHRGYDSMTEMNDWGMMRLGEMSAKGLLPAGKEGGSLLQAADALREGTFVAGGGSPAQVGFMQNRSHQWIANIRSIPDQVMPATCTFAVEAAKGDDDSGGIDIFGPQIAGNKRTSKVPRWLGNCLHANREPDAAGNMRHRLWLTSHIDPRDPRKTPYLAKHRGLPLGMPDFLEDPWDDDKAKRDAQAWSVCSLGVFYRKLIAQLKEVEALQATKYANAPGLQAYETGDDVIGDVAAPALVAPINTAGVHVAQVGGQTMSQRRSLRVPGAVAPAPGPPPVAIAAATAVAPPIPAATVAPLPALPATTLGPAAGLVVAPPAAGAGISGSQPIPAPAAPSPSVAPAAVVAPSPVVAQLEASLAARAPGVVPATAATQTQTAPPSATVPSVGVSATGAAPASPPAAPSRLRAPGGLRTPGATVAPAPTQNQVKQLDQTGPTIAHPNAVSAPTAAVVAAPSPVSPPPAVPAATVVAPAPIPAPLPPAPALRPPARRIPRPPV